MKITLNKGGTKEKTVELSKLIIPDLWHIASRQDDPRGREKILEIWHLCHDLKRALEVQSERPQFDIKRDADGAGFSTTITKGNQ